LFCLQFFKLIACYLSFCLLKFNHLRNTKAIKTLKTVIIEWCSTLGTGSRKAESQKTRTILLESNWI